jgi:hypothetical protein
MDNKLNSAGVPSWDNDFNEFGVRKGSLDDQGGRTQADEDELHKHQLEMELLQSQLEVVKENQGKKNKLILNTKSGEVVYFSGNGRQYKTSKPFGRKTNSFLLLDFLSKYPQIIFKADDLVKHLKNPRSGGEYSLPDRRIRDTIQTVRERMELSAESDFFVMESGFGIKCDVELIA